MAPRWKCNSPGRWPPWQVRVEPQVEQKPRNMPGEDANLVISPLVTSTTVSSKATNAAAGAPQCLRQLWQWHHIVQFGAPLARNRTAPHRHPPSHVSLILRSLALSDVRRSDLDQLRNDSVNLLGGRPASEAETHGALPHLRRHSHRRQRRRHLHPALMASRAGRGGDALERAQDFGADAADKSDIESVGQAMLGVPVQHDTVAERRMQLIPETVAQGLHGGHRREVLSQGAGFAEAGGQQRALGARAPTALVTAAVDEGLQHDAAAHVERADPLGGIELVSDDSEQVDAQIIYPDRDLADGLGRVGVEQ